MRSKHIKIDERQEKDKRELIEKLKEMPIVHAACKRAGVSRATYYRWCIENEVFRKAAEEAIAEGEALITDMSESQLISLIREKKFPAVHLWLRTHHQKYKDKLEIINRPVESDTPLTTEQKMKVKKALKLGKLAHSKKDYAKFKSTK